MPDKIRRAITLCGLYFGGLCLNSAVAENASTDATLNRIQNIVVIYAENRSFDNLYGLFPGADGIQQALQQPEHYLQLDRDGSTVLSHLPPLWSRPTPDWAFIGTLPNQPFRIDEAHGDTPAHGLEIETPDPVHRHYNHQLQLNGGATNRFAAFSDVGGLTMGYYDGSRMALWQLAQQYTLADHFFMGAFGGSFLNHFWLVCACTPSELNPPADQLSVLDPQTGLLAYAPGSALDSPPKYVKDGGFTPLQADSRLAYAINTRQPPYQPSITPPAINGDARLADPNAAGKAAPLSPQTQTTIGDTLSAKNIDWRWYSGAWRAALADGMQTPDKKRAIIDNEEPGSPDFQTHHQPFNYFARFDPTTPQGRAQRAAHLQDAADFIADAEQGRLPPVAFYKPQGNLNQHSGYSEVMAGDTHIAALITQLQASPQWPNMLIIVTYDENGGYWDHVAPPKGDRWGPGSRIPAIFISPWVKKNHVEHSVYDTTSIAKLISKRFDLAILPGARNQFGDLTEILLPSAP
jgi:acid phosphatase